MHSGTRSQKRNSAEEAKDFFDFRSISLVCSLYKIIAKVLSMSVSGVMDKIISNTQGTFVKERQVMDGILIANEYVDWRKRSNIPGLICKIDLEKAYDMMDWGFFGGSLRRKGLGIDGLVGY